MEQHPGLELGRWCADEPLTRAKKSGHPCGRPEAIDRFRRSEVYWQLGNDQLEMFVLQEKVAVTV